MEHKPNILYIHGMGGGGDSRIPRLLRSSFESMENGPMVFVRTYSFDPEIARASIQSWVEELKPSLIIGESLGFFQALLVTGVPHIYVSPATGAASWLCFFRSFTWIPGIPAVMRRIWRVKEGDRQQLTFVPGVLKKYRNLKAKALKNTPLNGNRDYSFAFFGTEDHYRKSGTVNIKTWRKYFGDNFQLYEGTHFMEDRHVESLLIPKILEVLSATRNNDYICESES